MRKKCRCKVSNIAFSFTPSLTRRHAHKSIQKHRDRRGADLIQSAKTSQKDCNSTFKQARPDRDVTEVQSLDPVFLDAAANPRARSESLAVVEEALDQAARAGIVTGAVNLSGVGALKQRKDLCKHHRLSVTCFMYYQHACSGNAGS